MNKIKEPLELKNHLKLARLYDKLCMELEETTCSHGFKIDRNSQDEAKWEKARKEYLLAISEGSKLLLN